MDDSYVGWLERGVMRSIESTEHLNTINLMDLVIIDLVWYPGAQDVANSRIDPVPAAEGDAPVLYTWTPSGGTAEQHELTTGRIEIALPPGGSGVLNVFDTDWQITRAGVGVTMDAVNTMRGVQQRLNALGYHLRSPGQVDAGVDGIEGKITELAIVDFQVDYRPAATAPPPANRRLRVRGEYRFNGNLSTMPTGAANNFSAADGAAFQAALREAMGS